MKSKVDAMLGHKNIKSIKGVNRWMAHNLPVILVMEVLIVMIVQYSRLRRILNKFLHTRSSEETTIRSPYPPC